MRNVKKRRHLPILQFKSFHRLLALRELYILELAYNVTVSIFDKLLEKQIIYRLLIFSNDVVTLTQHTGYISLITL